jgi:predicted carbohydrate-binding protein with CBM5 and CBM33 domain
VTKDQLTWAALENLGRWSLEDPARPVTNGTAPSPAGGRSLSYDWSIPVPPDRSGRHVVVVIWQRVDPAGEAFFAVQDLAVTAALTPPPDVLILTRRKGRVGSSGTAGRA